MRSLALFAGLAASAIACAPVPAPTSTPRAPAASVLRAPAADAGPAASRGHDLEDPGHVDRDAEKIDHVRAMLKRVADARGLPVHREVRSRVLGRDAILEKIKAHVEEDVPLDVVATQSEILAALELVPADYDLVAGIFRLVGGQIAGFYEPADETMYLVDDQDDAELDQTLAHELDHALQDQSFPLTPLLKFVPGDSDRIGAVHCLIEGDAVSAMLDVEFGSAFRVAEGAMRRLFAVSTALSEVGGTTPHVLQEELISPYTDGFPFVQALRRRGGWPAVDGALRHPPETTEQLLHLEKYDAHEAALPVSVPKVDPLGPGWTSALDDVMGEQGLRIAFGEWTARTTATAAAAGWGGDRYVVAKRSTASGRREVAVGWHLRMDTPSDADEVAVLLSAQFGASCRERGALGPLVWTRKGRDLAVVAGPYVREGIKAAGAAGTCAVAARWAAAILATP